MCAGDTGACPDTGGTRGRPGAHTQQIADHQAEGSWLQSLPEAPVFRPTAAEWEDPLRYIASIRAEGEAAGLAVVVSPFAPSVLPAQGLSRSLGTFRARWQRLERVRARKWEPPGFEEDARPYTLQRFVKEAEKETRRLFGGLSAAPPPRAVEREYWARHGRAGKARRGRVYALYANDIPGSAFCARDALGASRWNLNTLAQEPGCVLRACPDPVPGVTQPMLYLGSAFASFAWHVEDQRLASINYAHAGAAKVWYGVPAAHADAFEAAVGATYFAAAPARGARDRAARAAVALAEKTVLVSPEELTRRGVRVVRAEQHPGSFVLTFPRAYHAGFSAGVHLGEAINLSLDDWWWPHGDAARREYRALRRPEVAPYEMLLCHRALEVATDGAGGNAGERVLAMSQDDPPGALVPPKRVECVDNQAALRRALVLCVTDLARAMDCVLGRGGELVRGLAELWAAADGEPHLASPTTASNPVHPACPCARTQCSACRQTLACAVALCTRSWRVLCVHCAGGHGAGRPRKRESAVGRGPGEVPAHEAMEEQGPPPATPVVLLSAPWWPLILDTARAWAALEPEGDAAVSGDDSRAVLDAAAGWRPCRRPSNPALAAALDRWADVEVPGRVKRFAKALPEDEPEVDRTTGVEEAVPKPMAHDPDSESTELEFEIELPYLEPSPDAAVDTAVTSLPESAQANGVLNGPYNASNGIATPTQSEPAAAGQRKRSWFKVEPGQSRFGRAIRPSQWVSQADDSMYAE